MILYKYYPSKLTIVLKNQMVRFTPPAELNDAAFDCKPIVSRVYSESNLNGILDEVFGENLHVIMKDAAENFIASASIEEIVFVIRNALIRSMSNPKTLTPLSVRMLDDAIRKDVGKLDKSKIADKLLSTFEVVLKKNPELLALARNGTMSNMMGIERELRPQMEQSLHTSIDSMVGVFCLSSTATCPVMWAIYADSGKGFVLGFDSDSPFFDQRKREDDILRRLYPVCYTDERASISFDDFLDSNTTSQEKMDIFIREAMLKKGRVWAHEKEWRIFQELSQANEVTDIPNGKAHLFKFPEESIKEIILGYSMSKADIAEIESIIETKYQNSVVRKAYISREEHTINSGILECE